MSHAARRVVAVAVTVVSAAGLAVVVAELFRGVIFGANHADPVWLILGAAWVAAMLAATVTLWAGAERRSKGALWTGAVALLAGAPILASSVAGAAHQAIVIFVAAVLATGLIAAAQPGRRRDRERSS
jgi:hypothetical protein